jgi:hypothetical protein
MARSGPPPKPVERKRATGNPGKRRLPEVRSAIVIPDEVEVPIPPRPLGADGTVLWDRAWTAAHGWLSPATDGELLLMLCESIDERATLRYRVMAHGDGDERKALRSLDKQIMAGLSLLGFTPTDRTRLGLAEVKKQSKIEELRERQAARSVASPVRHSRNSG